MKKWKGVRVKQELVDQIKKEVEKKEYRSLTEFVSEAIKQRLQTLTKQRVSEYLERDKAVRTPQLQARLFYTPKHIWGEMTYDGAIEVGITNYFQSNAKEIVNIKTDKVGEKVSKDRPFGVIETWWFVYDLYPPINGKIVSINRAVIDDPFILNADPYQWIVKVKPTQLESNSWAQGLLDLGEYKKLVTKLEGVPIHMQAAKLRAQTRAHKKVNS